MLRSVQCFERSWIASNGSDRSCVPRAWIASMEVEAKLATRTRRTLAAIARLRKLGRYRLTPVGVRDLETTYLDTSRKDLLRQRIALRLRRFERGVELTLKRSGKSARGIHRRPETTWKLRKMPRLPLVLRRGELRELERFTAGRPIVPLVGTRIRRRANLVRRHGGAAPSAEIACDEVRFFDPTGGRRASARSADYEVEVELLGGEEKDLRAIVRGLRARYPLRASSGSKLERALRWAGVRAQ